MLISVAKKVDFPFAKVPVPSVKYLDDKEEMVTLLCQFEFPNWGNVSFEIQWFVNGRGYNPDRICESTDVKCDKRSFELSSCQATTPHFKPGDNVKYQLLRSVNLVVLTVPSLL